MAAQRFYVNTTDRGCIEYENDMTATSRVNPIVNAVRSLDEMYKPVHGYLAAVVCVLGITANIVNVIVLTRKGMLSAVHIFLTGLAVSDGLTVVFYFPYLIQMYLMHGTDISPERNNRTSVRYELAFAVISVILHSISIWLTVTLAMLRYLFIRIPRLGLRFGNAKSAVRAMVVVVFTVTIVCIPNSILYQVESSQVSLNDTCLNRSGSIWSITKKNDALLQNINFWIYSILIKLLPCFLLMLFSVLIIRTMRIADQKRSRMTLNDTFALRTIRTTKMLLCVVILSVLTETPHGILVLLSGLIPDFFVNFYIPLGDLLDVIALINSGVNFVLYCTMSKQFRTKFLSLFCRCTDRNNKRTERRIPSDMKENRIARGNSHLIPLQEQN